MHMHTQLYTTFTSTPQTCIWTDCTKKKQQHSLGAKFMQHIPRLLTPYLSAAESFLSHSVPQWTRPGWSVTTLVLHQSLNFVKQWRQVLLRVCGLHCCLRNWVLQPKTPLPSIFVHGWYVTAWYCFKSCQIARVELQHWDWSQLYLWQKDWTGREHLNRLSTVESFQCCSSSFLGRNWKWQIIP